MADIPQPVLTLSKDITLVGDNYLSHVQQPPKTFKAGDKIIPFGFGDNTVIYIEADSIRYEIPNNAFIENPVSVVADYQSKIKSQQAIDTKAYQQKLDNQTVVEKAPRYLDRNLQNPYVASAVAGGLALIISSIATDNKSAIAKWTIGATLVTFASSMLLINPISVIWGLTEKTFDISYKPPKI